VGVLLLLSKVFEIFQTSRQIIFKKRTTNLQKCFSNFQRFERIGISDKVKNYFFNKQIFSQKNAAGN
jgi:hypothetical protein